MSQSIIVPKCFIYLSAYVSICPKCLAVVKSIKKLIGLVSTKKYVSCWFHSAQPYHFSALRKRDSTEKISCCSDRCVQRLCRYGDLSPWNFLTDCHIWQGYLWLSPIQIWPSCCFFVPSALGTKKQQEGQIWIGLPVAVRYYLTVG